MPITLSNLTKVLIQDNRASVNDAKILERVVDAGHASRADLDTCIDLIESSGLDDAQKKSALRELEGFMESTATGLEKELFGASTSLINRLGREGIETPADLLEKARTPAQRESLAHEINYDEKEIRQLAKQADLLRVDGMDSKLAKVLIDAGIDSVPELGSRNAENLYKKLRGFSGTQDSWIIKFKCPSKDDVKALVDAAKGLDRVLEFGRPTSGFEALSIEDRVKMMNDWQGPLRSEDIDDPAAFFRDAGVPDVAAAMPHIVRAGMQFVSNYMEYNGPDNVSVDDLVSGRVTSETLMDSDGIDLGFSNKPEVTAFKDDAGNLVGAKLSFGFYADPAEYSQSFFYDHIEKRLTHSIEEDHYNGEELYSESIYASEPMSGTKESRLGNELFKIAEGLTYISEGDEPWRRVVASDMPGSITEANLKEHVISFPGAEYSIRDTADFWDYYLDPDTYGQPEADQYGRVKDWMESNLHDIKFVHVGNDRRVDNYVYLVGLSDEGKLVGLQAKSIET